MMIRMTHKPAVDERAYTFVCDKLRDCGIFSTRGARDGVGMRCMTKRVGAVEHIRLYNP